MTCSALLRSSRYATSGARDGDGEALGWATAVCVGDWAGVGPELEPALGAGVHAAASTATSDATAQASACCFSRTDSFVFGLSSTRARSGSFLHLRNRSATIRVMPELDAPRIDLPRKRLMVVTFGLLLSMMLSALDTSIVATAMPRIIAELSGLEYYAWVTTAYLVTSTTIIPISGKLGDLFGRKRFIQGGMIGFVAASALCGIAQSMPQLVAARALQGVFGGFLTSSALGSMADLYLPATRA